MRVFLGAMLLAVALLAGCSGVQTAGSNGPAYTTEQAICEQSRGGGVWIAAAGACVRGGGAM
jgi:uncharacterized protein YceK